jgi:GT2 family glycosyltransferase
MISVLVCTCDRGPSLQRCLASFESAAASHQGAWELVVVDNNSTDRTREVVDTLRKKGSLPIIYIFEPRQGKSYALNRGIRCSGGDIIAFIDDDCFVAANWLVSLEKEFQADHTLGGIGGRVELCNQSDKPVTIRLRKERILVDSSNLVNLIAGCNMAFRRQVVEKVGMFDVAFGPGTKMVVEDTDFVYRAFKEGFKIVYSPDLLVYHNHGRNTDEQVRALNRSYVIGRGAFYCKHILAGDRAVAKMAYWETRSLIRDSLKKLSRLESSQEEFWVLGNLGLGATYELINKSRGGVLGSPEVPSSIL